MSTKKSKKSKSARTRNTGQTVVKEQKEQLKPSLNGALRWIKTHDLRLVPAELLRQSDNKQINPDAFINFAIRAFNDPLMWCLYGVNPEGIIEAAVFGHFNLLDHCLYIIQCLGVTLDNEDLMNEIRFLGEQAYVAKAIKMENPQILEVFEREE